MRERKQSFLERLTGTRTVESEGAEERTAIGNMGAEKHWSPYLDGGNADENDVAAMYTKNPENDTAKNRDEESGRDEDESEEAEGEATLSIDMYESDNELIIQCMIAGVTPENLHVAITRDMVTIRGRRVAPEGIPEEQQLAQELYWGPFSREINLPFEIDTGGAEAVEKYGLLVIRLPKLDTAKTQELRVRSVE